MVGDSSTQHSQKSRHLSLNVGNPDSLTVPPPDKVVTQMLDLTRHQCPLLGLMTIPNPYLCDGITARYASRVPSRPTAQTRPHYPSPALADACLHPAGALHRTGLLQAQGFKIRGHIASQ